MKRLILRIPYSVCCRVLTASSPPKSTHREVSRHILFTTINFRCKGCIRLAIEKDVTITAEDLYTEWTADLLPYPPEKLFVTAHTPQTGFSLECDKSIITQLHASILKKQLKVIHPVTPLTYIKATRPICDEDTCWDGICGTDIISEVFHIKILTSTHGYCRYTSSYVWHHR